MQQSFGEIKEIFNAGIKEYDFFFATLSCFKPFCPGTDAAGR
jgi:hypothetical protein